MTERKVYRTRINEDVECVIFEDDKSVEIRPVRDGHTINLNNDDSYKLFSCLQSLFEEQQ